MPDFLQEAGLPGLLSELVEATDVADREWRRSRTIESDALGPLTIVYIGRVATVEDATQSTGVTADGAGSRGRLLDRYSRPISIMYGLVYRVRDATPSKALMAQATSEALRVFTEFLENEDSFVPRTSVSWYPPELDGGSRAPTRSPTFEVERANEHGRAEGYLDRPGPRRPPPPHRPHAKRWVVVLVLALVAAAGVIVLLRDISRETSQVTHVSVDAMPLTTAPLCSGPTPVVLTGAIDATAGTHADYHWELDPALTDDQLAGNHDVPFSASESQLVTQVVILSGQQWSSVGKARLVVTAPNAMAADVPIKVTCQGGPESGR
ncbi:hypothetical protein [Actinomycetospora sp. TBRC 11914]|uniref:hypothetical protein n=1 Tax=Actinomycetospora sp. TBRC 11914 TaxID=2729387 RepID=UPI00145F5451|nr:hypothetical protein [Actinomycetospora sp. TBRC 11914]NMO90321.1 hypothetical protein [Actinomycetospora sp. TBRC 11914]